jgi:hypothetical protein
MYVLGNPVMRIDPDGRWSKFGAWFRSKFDKGAGKIYKTKDGVDDDWGYNRSTYDKNGKVDGWEGVFEKNKTGKSKSKNESGGNWFKREFTKFKKWLKGFDISPSSPGDPYYGSQKKGDPITNRQGNASEIQSMPGGLIPVNWPFKQTETNRQKIPEVLQKHGTPLEDRNMPQSMKRSGLDPNEKIWIPFTIKQADGSKVGGMSLESRKDSLKFVNSHPSK